jgi:hypothetical protein
MATPNNFEITIVIFQTQRNVITPPETMFGQCLAKTIRCVIQLFVGVRKAALGHNDGELVGCGLGDMTWEHA